MDRSHLLTEQRLLESTGLDTMSLAEAIAVMNAQDANATNAVAAIANDLERAVELIVRALQMGGRLIYFGAGSSGRLGVLDASEVPPTFGASREMVLGVIAGGREAMFVAQEGAEDSIEGGQRDVAAMNVCDHDAVVGIAAGGTTPYVISVLEAAKQAGATTIFLTCVSRAGEPSVDVVLRPLVGPEVLAGSTRLKAGTATKLVLNQLSTLAMVRLGKCYDNLMVDLKATNAKLRDRAIRMIATLCGSDALTSERLLDAAGGHVKLAVVMHHKSLDASDAKSLLKRSKGQLRIALEAPV